MDTVIHLLGLCGEPHGLLYNIFILSFLIVMITIYKVFNAKKEIY